MPEKNEQYESLADAIGRIANSVERLRKSGLNTDAIIVLTSDSTKLPKRTVKRVLEGLNDLSKYYLERS